MITRSAHSYLVGGDLQGIIEAMIGVQLITIFVAAFSSCVLAFIWYHPKLFGSAFVRLSGMTPEQLEAGKKNMPMYVFFALLASMLTAYVMSYMLPVFVYPDWIGAIELAIWIWVGFVAPIMLGSVLWERRSFKLYLINALYWLAALIIMSFILLESSILFGSAYQQGITNTQQVEINE